MWLGGLYHIGQKKHLIRAHTIIVGLGERFHGLPAGIGGQKRVQVVWHRFRGRFRFLFRLLLFSAFTLYGGVRRPLLRLCCLSPVKGRGKRFIRPVPGGMLPVVPHGSFVCLLLLPVGPAAGDLVGEPAPAAQRLGHGEPVHRLGDDRLAVLRQHPPEKPLPLAVDKQSAGGGHGVKRLCHLPIAGLVRGVLLPQRPGIHRIGQRLAVGVADDELPRDHRMCSIQCDPPRLPGGNQRFVPRQEFAFGQTAGASRVFVVLCWHKQPSSFCDQPLLRGADRLPAINTPLCRKKSHAPKKLNSIYFLISELYFF